MMRIRPTEPLADPVADRRSDASPLASLTRRLGVGSIDDDLSVSAAALSRRIFETIAEQEDKMPGSATLTVDGPIARIAYANPDNGYMDEAMEGALLDAVLAVEADPAIRVCVHIGIGPGVFIRHYDVAVLYRRASAMAAKGYAFTEERPVPEGGIHKAMAAMEAGSTIHVGALNGSAMGGGFELALACDLRLVESGPHEFGLPEVNIGVLPGAGGTQRLTRLVGEAKALQMTLLGEVIGPDALAQAGLAVACVPDVASAAAEMASRLAAKPPRAIAHIKRLVRGAAEPAQAFAAERTLFCDLMVSDDAIALMGEMANGTRVITDEP